MNAMPPLKSGAAATERPTLEAQQVSKSFRSGMVQVNVLRNLSIKLYAGELTLLAGPSGCGKSTLLSLLSGLQEPDGGRVVALGEQLCDFSRRELARFRLHHTGFVFQGFHLFPALTALEQVELPLGHLGVGAREARDRALQALEDVGLQHRARMLPEQLSGGEKQRVAIARAVAKQPEFLFADEPTSSLDAANGQMVIDILHRLALARGTTVLCASHDPRLVRHADRVLAMEDGRIQNDWQPRHAAPAVLEELAA